MKQRLIVLTLSVLIGISAYSQKAHKTHIAITPGLDLATMNSTDSRGTNVRFPDGRNFRLGFDWELPIRSSKWSAFIEPTYQRYFANERYYLKYTSIEFPIGIRRYFSVRENTGLFLEGAFVGDFPMTYQLRINQYAIFNATRLTGTLLAGAGIAFSRFRVSYRYYTRRTTTDDFDSFRFNYQKRAIILGFILF